MKNMFFNSVLVAFVLLVASCSKQPEAKVDVMSFNIRLDHVADVIRFVPPLIITKEDVDTMTGILRKCISE